jgi:hypothetical protein
LSVLVLSFSPQLAKKATQAITAKIFLGSISFIGLVKFGFESKLSKKNKKSSMKCKKDCYSFFNK